MLAFAKSTGVTYPLGLDPGADIFAKYALRESGITRNVLIDKEGKIVKLTRLYPSCDRGGSRARLLCDYG